MRGACFVQKATCKVRGVRLAHDIVVTCMFNLSTETATERSQCAIIYWLPSDGRHILEVFQGRQQDLRALWMSKLHGG